MNNEKFVLATGNIGKVAEMSEILAGYGIQAVGRVKMGLNVDIEETGLTFIENAIIKAQSICDLTSLASIGDDSGLVVDALGDQPGIYSSSYGGDELSDLERCMYLLANMEHITQREAKFVCAVACAFPNGDLITVTGECIGIIVKEPRGENGFGYDPVFMPSGMDKTIGELSPIEKNAISHRGKALKQLADALIDRN
ncbi:MAG: RdgB/HAM1 family non-canonical purine NTP pyrophosphatase [Oscillospiraceae bacterium]|nr:RdgB/HAM1 family non-canonical purine NTP pyrophosphatase [Oscillospiraceae bacterium]